MKQTLCHLLFNCFLIVGVCYHSTCVTAICQEAHGVWNHRHLHGLLTYLFRRTSKKITKLHITDLCGGNPPVTGGFPSQGTSSADFFSFDDVIMYWHTVLLYFVLLWLYLKFLIKSSPPNAAYMRQWIGTALVQIMGCRQFGTNPLSKPMLVYCQLDSWDQISVKLESEFSHFHSQKCIWKKFRLPKWVVPVPMTLPWKVWIKSTEAPFTHME